MVKTKSGVRSRLIVAVRWGVTCMKWGWIPLILYLGKYCVCGALHAHELDDEICHRLNSIGIKRGCSEPGMPQPTLFR